MKNKIIYLIPLMIFLLSTFAFADTQIVNFYTNTSARFDSLSYSQDASGVKYVVGLDIQADKGMYFINESTGNLNAYRIFNASSYPKYAAKQYENYFYIRRYNGTVGNGVIERYNLSYENATQIITAGYTTSSGGDRFQAFVGKYNYWLTGTSANYLQVKDITNGTTVYTNAYAFYFDKTNTECNGSIIQVIGYDYDNDELYFTCASGDLVYIKEDFYFTQKLFNNIKFDETLINNITNPISANSDAQGQIKFALINSTLYMINASNTSQILKQEFVDEYANLVCTSVNGSTYCVNPYGYCVPPIFGPDLTYYCINVSLTSSGLPYCNGEQYQTYCSSSCTNIEATNTYGVTYDNGVCLQNNSCTNECNTLGESYSDSSSSYVYCTLNPVSGCLEYSGTIECDTGESSIDGECINTTFSGGVGTLTGWSTTPLVNVAFTNDANLKYNPINYGSTPKSVDIWHSNSFINLKFYSASTTTPYYLVRWCNYTTTTIYDSPSINTNYNSSDFVVTPNGYYNGISELGFTPESDTGILLKGVDSLDREAFKYYIYRNSTLGVCVYYPNATSNMSRLLGCINTASDNLYKIVASVQTFENTNTIKMDVYTGLTTFTTYYGTLITKVNPASLTITKFNHSIENATIRHFKITNDIQNSDINAKLVNVTDDYTTNGCYINTLGCRTIRSYYMNYDASNWNLYNYKDWKVCVISLGGVALESTDSEGGIFSGWTKRQKLLFAFGTSIVLLMVLVIMGMLQSYDDEKRPLIWVGIFVFVASLIFFTVIGWIALWMLIVPTIIASLGVSIFFLNKSGGQ